MLLMETNGPTSMVLSLCRMVQEILFITKIMFISWCIWLQRVLFGVYLLERIGGK